MSGICLDIDSEISNVPLVGMSVRSVCSSLTGEEQAGLVELAVVEAVTNAIKHAYRGESGKSVIVRLTVSDEALTIEVIDSGNSIPPIKLKAAEALLDFDSENMDAIPTSGMGLGIIQRVADEFLYENIGGQNVLRMTIYLHQRDL